MGTADFHDFLRALSRGDPRAVEELDRRYRPYLCRVVRPWLADAHLRSIADSTDIYQTALLKFVASLQKGRYHDLQTEAELEKVLCRIAQNTFRDLRRHERPAGPAATPAETAQDLAASTSTPSQHAARAELERLFLARLSAQARQVHAWKAAGWKWAQIGAALNLPPNTIRIRFDRECQRVARELDL